MKENYYEARLDNGNIIINYNMMLLGLVQMFYGFLLHIQVDDFFNAGKL